MSRFERQALQVSVVVPTRDRATRLAALLDSMANVRAPHVSWEVIVVDNGSTDATAAVVRQAARTAPMPLRYVYEPEPGLHAGRHRGAHEARGEVIAYLDDDTRVHREWLRGSLPVLRGLADAVVSRFLPRWEAPVPSWLEDLVHTGQYLPLGLLDLGEEQREVQSGLVLGGGCFIMRSKVFELGGFNPDSMPAGLLRFRGDGESGLMRKFAAAGHCAWYDPSSVVEHAVPAERMSHSYLRGRFYREGISASFSELRKEPRSSVDIGPVGVPTESPGVAASVQPGGTPRGRLSIARRRLAGGLRRGRAWASRSVTASSRAREQFDEDLRHALQQGRDFHRRAAETDVGVMAWVTLPSFIGVSLADFNPLAGPHDPNDIASIEG